MNPHLADYYSRPIEIVDGEGCFLFDRQGKRYIDFLAGWCVGNVGWKRSEIREAIEYQAGVGIYVPPMLRYAGWEEFASLLIKHAPNKNLSRVFRCTSGSEAVEFAIKLARASSGKQTIVSIDGVYHGHTYGAASLGDACSKGMAPCLPGFIKLPMPNAALGQNSHDVVEAFASLLRDRNDIAAFMSEPVWTNAGAIVPPPDFYPAIERLCRQHGVLLVMDEVATGFGRCGTLFGSELWGIKPDIVCLAKGMTGGYATLGATLVTEEIYKAHTHIPYYSTFGWLPQDLAATRANVEIILKEKLWENAAMIGKRLLKQLKLLEDLPFVGEVRGIGLVIGIEIVRNKTSHEPDYARATQLQDRCAEEGLIIETAGNALFITPPLVLDQETTDEGVAILNRVLGE